ncbi:MAG: type I 3-dehydroquinate dehydratase [Nitrososphaera sp.]|jgi:3-dehydroquinate dehydratase-1
MAKKTCAVVATQSPAKAVKVLRVALANSDYAELRLDFLKPSQIPYCLNKVRRYLNRCVCTLRPKSEGGKFSGSEKERTSILKLIAEYKPYLLDVEYNTLRRNDDLIKYLKKTGTNILVSWHDFSKTPDDKTLRSMLKNMSKFSKNVKIVTTSKTISDTIRVLGLYKAASKLNLVCFAMGDYGRMSRVICAKLGSPFTYVSIGKPVAPGQFSLQEMKRIFTLEIG